jgi:MFS family permease
MLCAPTNKSRHSYRETAFEKNIRARDAVRGASFRWLTAAFCLVSLAKVAVTVHLIPYLTDRGYSAGFAATAAGMVGTMALPGRLIFTPLGGRIARRYVTAAIFLCQTVGLVVLVTAPSTAGVVVFVVLFGLGFGAITPARGALVAEMYGATQYGSINGVLAFFVTGASALAPVSAGLLYAAFGRYQPVFWMLIVISALATGAILLIGDDLPESAIADRAIA